MSAHDAKRVERLEARMTELERQMAALTQRIDTSPYARWQERRAEREREPDKTD